MNDDQLQDVLDDVATLVKEAGRAKRGNLSVSPEVAALLREFEPAGRVGNAGERQIDVMEVRDESTMELDELAACVSECTKCPLSKTRTKTVFGSGNVHAELLFVGEAPGEDEDLQGKPFVGRAGQLLTDIIEKGVGVPRNEVYICNVLKCRPPNNRDPLPAEIEQCEPYLIRQLELIRPKVICALGAHAAHTLLRCDLPVGKLRGVWHSYHGIPLRVTYHPAYLLRTPGDKVKAWADIKEIIKVLQGEAPPSTPAKGQDLLA